MWYILIFVLIAGMVVAYRKMKAIERYNIADFTLFECLLGNGATVMAIGALAMAAVFLVLLLLSPGGQRYRRRVRHQEAAYLGAAAEVIGERLRGKIKVQDKILVIVDDHGDSGVVYETAIEKGLEAGLGRDQQVAVHRLVLDRQADTPESVVANQYTFRAEDLRYILERYSEQRVIISFAGAPIDFDKSYLYPQAAAGDKVFAVYSTNPYLLGGAIFHGGITGCIVPKYVIDHRDRPPPVTDIPEAFDRRFVWCDAENIKVIAEQNRRLIRLTRSL